MHQIKILFYFIFLLIIAYSCIEKFEPQIESAAVNKYVVFGQITDQEGYQTVSISLTSVVRKPEYIPLTDCNVRIKDNKGNEYILEEFDEGYYRVWMDSQQLLPGTSYQLTIITPAGVKIISALDQMTDCPDVDSVYYTLKEVPTTNPEVSLNGIQIYLDFNGKNTNSRYYRWELEETYEYHSPYPLQFYYIGRIVKLPERDYSNSFCWLTQMVKNIYTLSTANLTENNYKKYPLHFIDNKGPELLYGYSLLVMQYALSETAHTYWEQLRINSSSHGGLYDTQPLPIKGNLENLTSPNQEVLGLFCASSVKSKRIFIKNVDNLEIKYKDPCYAQPLGPGGWGYLPGDTIYFIQEGGISIIDKSCIDCRLFGGKTTKPEFWPK